MDLIQPSLLSEDEIVEFCQTFIRTRNFSAACERIERARDYVAEALNRCDEFKKAFQNARDRITDDIEADILNKCQYGWEKEVWYKGEHVGSQTQYDPALALKVLALRRSEWRGQEEDTNVAALLSKLIGDMQITVPRIMDGTEE